MIADRSGPLELDDEARRLAHTWFSSPLVVEAGAGTGKTALLTARVVAWSVGPGWRRHAEGRVESALVARRVAERVVAITFTEAAAAEMAERVAVALADLTVGRSPIGLMPQLLEVTGTDLQERCAALANEVHRLPIQTIHSFCHRVLRAFPLEAGLHPSFEVDAEGRRVEQIVEEAIEPSLRSDDHGGEWQRLAAHGVGPQRVSEALQELIRAGVTLEELDHDPYSPRAVARLAERLEQALAEFWRAASAPLVTGTAKTVTAGNQLRGLTERLAGRASEVSFDELRGAVAAVGDAGHDRLHEWAKGTFTATDRAALNGNTAPVAAAAAGLAVEIADVAAACPAELAAARGLLASLLDQARTRMRAAGVVTFDDLLRGTAELLDRSPAVAGEARRGIDQLLIDEFQDTDDTQCRIVAKLALEGQPEGRPGLFIVGDPKQSIYGWRRADLAAYDTFKQEVAEAGGTSRPLVRNYRSHRPILDEVERVVAPVMVRRHGLQPGFEALEATEDRRSDPGFSVGDWTPVEHWLAWTVDRASGACGPAARVDEATALEAAAVAGDIRRLHDERAVCWRDIALLLRKTTRLEPLLAAMRAERVPFQVARERDYYRQREVVEAAALVRCVFEPSDQLALLTVMRSDAVGVPDAALVPLWDAGLPSIAADLHEPGVAVLAAVERCVDRARAMVPSRAPGLAEVPDWPLAVTAALDTLAVLRSSVRRDPPDLFVERLRTMWLSEVTASARYLGRFRRARLERFLDRLAVALVEGGGSLAPVARFLRRAVEEAREPELPSQPDVSTDAVHVMTIHSAKGLDFQHVYLLQTHAGDGGPIGTPAVEWRRGTGGPCYRLFGWPTPGYAAADVARIERDREERVRLLYVAMTRAKRRLVISGGRPANADLVTATDAKNFAELLAHRADPGALADQASASRHRRTEADGLVQWVLPVFGPQPPATASPQGNGARAVDVDRVAADAALLAELRVDAATRMAEPLVAAVTGIAHRPLAAESGAEHEPLVASDRDLARLLGTEVHRVLENLDLSADLVAQVRDQRVDVERRLAAPVKQEHRRAAIERVAEIFERIETGTCLARLAELTDDVVARELPLIVPPGEVEVGAIVGTADLVYREGDEVVVADYKTDAVTETDDIAERVAAYRPQLELYARALAEGLDLLEPPQMELWFLHADRIVRL